MKVGEKISAVLITKNEAKVIERCIKSLKGVDEVVILDTGSTDNTVEIARSLGAKVKAADPLVPFHFATARNVAQVLAVNDWVLVIDADEVLRAGMMRHIRQAIDAPQESTAFVITFTDRGATTRKIKLYRKSIWSWKYRVHEQLVGGDTKAIGSLERVIFEHLPEPDKKARRGQNIELLRMTIQENPEYIRAYKHLGQELMIEKNYEEAIPWLATFVEKTTEGPLEKSEVMMRLGHCYGELGRLEEACRWFDFSAQTDPRRREPLFNGGVYMGKKGKTLADMMIARDFLQRCISIPVNDRPGSHLDQPAVWGKEPHRLLKECQKQILATQPIA